MLRSLFFGLLLAATAQAAGHLFERLPSQDWRGSLVSGDFNRDGKLDLVELTSGNLVVRAGRGDGTFQEIFRTAIPPAQVYSVVTADFDGDGNPDLAASSWDHPEVYIWIGDGQGRFMPAPSMGFPKPPTPGPWAWIETLVAGDFNRDGNIDLMVQVLGYDFDGGSGPFHVLFGHGNGQFTTGPAFLSGIWGNVLLTDIDGDRIPDLVVRWALGPSGVYHSNGDGTFRLLGWLPLPDRRENFDDSGMNAADFNRDGITDLAIVDRAAVSILIGNGDGTFQLKTRIPTVNDTGGIAIADVNGDGLPDLLIRFGYIKPGKICLAIARGEGMFQDPVELEPGEGALVGDFDGDGRLDLLIEDWSTKSVALLLNRTPMALAPAFLGSAAGTAAAGIAPNMLISIFGSFLGESARPERTKVRINGSEAKVLYASENQINAQVASSVGVAGDGRLVIESPAGKIETTVRIVEYAPAIFRLSANEGAILHADNSSVSTASPAIQGETVTVLCTGLGQLQATTSVSVGGKPAVVRSARTSGESPMFDRVEFVVPEVMGGMSVPVELTIGGVRSNIVAMAVQ